MSIPIKSHQSGRKRAAASGRRPGAQPGNFNALKHGLRVRHPRRDPAEAQTLNGEIALTRVAARRMLELLEAEKTVGGKIALAKVISAAAVRVASLLKRKKYLNGGVDSLGAALEEALKSVAAETGLN